ncbi:hypothetical protein [Cryptosporangium sp. NPDC048952]|uniref:hypothetical protein n=1 Tax=Cryptosporangium sp. NPDC048952 TaxID=3363961 RepID=UPI00371B733A
MFLLVLLTIVGFWLVGKAKDERRNGGVPHVQAEPLWAKRGAELVPGCKDALVPGHPLPGDVTGDGTFEYLVTLHCGGADGADNVLVMDDWDPGSAHLLGTVTGHLPVHLQRGGCVHPDGRVVTVVGRALADGDPADRPSIVVEQTATWNGSSFTFGAVKQTRAASPGYGSALPGCR